MRRVLLTAVTTAVFASLPASPALAVDGQDQLRDDWQDVVAVCKKEGVRSNDCRDAVEEFVDEHRDVLKELADKHDRD